jgi:beta-glucosidase
MKKIVCFVLTCYALHANGQSNFKMLPFWNGNLNIEQRVTDLVSRLTLEEKVAQMLNHAPAIDRLGIPAYDWWNETLHGVARTPFKVTSYPQAIGMAATWDINSIQLMGDYSATEGRAIYNKAVQLNKTSERYWGLTYWTPNINIFRDPRWGRGQETYGEDPYLTAMLGTAIVKGLQGDDPVYLKSAACAKHFAVHSGPEPSRHKDNFNPSAYDLWDTYLPAFKELVVHANVAGVMCAYNAVNTQPCCGNDLLMTSILRNEWKFKGYVTSDCGGLYDFYRFHKTHKDALDAAADALIHSTDLECGNAVYFSLIDAVKKGIIKETQIDVSVKRLFNIRFKLGMFDEPSKVKYAQIKEDVLESAEHKALALKIAQQSIVLLKNQNNLLPLKKASIKRIAVIGPNADNAIAVLGNYNGTPSQIITVLEGIRNKLGSNVEVIYEKAINFTNDTLLTYNKTAFSQFSYDGKQGVKAEYFNNKDLKGTPEINTREESIDHIWQEGQTVIGSIKASNFSARYTTNYQPLKDGNITFEIDADDGYKLSINGKEIINAWTRNRWGAKTYMLPANKDSVYKISVEYWQGDGNAHVTLKIGDNLKTDFNNLANKLANVDAIIFAGGISPQLEGEEMPVNITGFNGGDRTSIRLPQVQTELLKSLQNIGKPIVFVMMTGSALAIPWENEHIPAIINTWYGGQSAGSAIADVLFGDYNPAGRLPVTFYASDTDLPDFSDYDMSNRTYRYFKGKPLYPFGFGLSYATFTYAPIKTTINKKIGTTITASTRVTNTSKKDGDEVVQLYISYPDLKEKAPIKSLKGFKRIFLKAGETKDVSFVLTPNLLSLVNQNGTSYQPKGKINISIGGGQPDIDIKTTSTNSKTHLIIQ